MKDEYKELIRKAIDECSLFFDITIELGETSMQQFHCYIALMVENRETIVKTNKDLSDVKLAIVSKIVKQFGYA
jgi:hypothetical protein